MIISDNRKPTEADLLLVDYFYMNLGYTLACIALKLRTRAAIDRKHCSLTATHIALRMSGNMTIRFTSSVTFRTMTVTVATTTNCYMMCHFFVFSFCAWLPFKADWFI
jgi:hypothetical protein